jgi:hypothetical protein
MSKSRISDWFYQYSNDVYQFLIYYLGSVDVEDMVQMNSHFRKAPPQKLGFLVSLGLWLLMKFEENKRKNQKSAFKRKTTTV